MIDGSFEIESDSASQNREDEAANKAIAWVGSGLSAEKSVMVTARRGRKSVVKESPYVSEM